jgi:hypothetical protein
MAFNPTSFETAYGFSTLDELHNFFPELLYDAELFPGEGLAWMRHRVHTLFPHVYPRQQNMYSIYHSHTRIQDYARWHREFRVSDTPPPAHRFTNAGGIHVTTPPVRFSVDLSGATPAGGAGVGAVYDQAPRLLSRRLQRTVDPLPQLFTSVLFDIPPQTPANNSFLNLLNMAFQDVIVSPTPEQIRSASRMETHAGMPADAICSICQEHDYEPEPEEDWRILHCGHSYHAPCIDAWLTSHVNCPVCRADVRTLRRPAPAGQQY